MFGFIVLVFSLAAAALAAPANQTLVPMLDGRIVGGDPTTIQSHPYNVQVLRNGNQFCGGTIISSTWIVSAAHCFTGTVNQFEIIAGSTIRNSGGQRIRASRILLHASYVSSTLDFDIALIELVSPITISVARAIGLAAQGGAPSAGITSTISGWGRLTEGGVSPSILQVVRVPILSQAQCRAAYGQARITDRMFCAGFLGVGGRDACQGDSGGPLIANGVLTGIVSWGRGCAQANFPGVYASIPNLRAWIRNVSGV